MQDKGTAAQHAVTGDVEALLARMTWLIGDGPDNAMRRFVVFSADLRALLAHVRALQTELAAHRERQLEDGVTATCFEKMVRDRDAAREEAAAYRALADERTRAVEGAYRRGVEAAAEGGE